MTTVWEDVENDPIVRIEVLGGATAAKMEPVKAAVVVAVVASLGETKGRILCSFSQQIASAHSNITFCFYVIY